MATIHRVQYWARYEDQAPYLWQGTLCYSDYSTRIHGVLPDGAVPTTRLKVSFADVTSMRILHTD